MREDDPEFNFLKGVAEQGLKTQEWLEWWGSHREEVRQAVPFELFTFLDNHGLRAGRRFLRQLRIEFGDPSRLSHAIGIGGCPLCGWWVTGWERCGSFSRQTEDGEPTGGGAFYRGRCRRCDVDFRLVSEKGRAPIWGLDAPEAGWLTEPVSAADLQALNQSAPRRFLSGDDWPKFVARAAAEDEYWRYDQPESFSGIARVRGGIPVARFTIRPPQWSNG